MNNQNELINKLFEEFKHVNGLKETEKFQNHSSQFKEWISIQQTYLTQYIVFLKEIGIDKEDLLAELNKCEYNSVVPHLINDGFNAISITKTKNAFNDNHVPCYNGNLTIYKNLPMVIYQTVVEMKSNPNCYNGLNNDISVFMTQLPNIDKSEIDILIKTSDNKTIIVGTYGSLRDKNYEQKIKQCSNIRDRLGSKSIVKSELFYGDNRDYYYIVKSTPKKLCKTH